MACCNLRMEPLKEIDEYRDNWWCSLADLSQGNPSYVWGSPGSESAAPANIWANPAPAAPFLSEQLSELGRQQWQQLAAMGSAPNYLSSQVIVFAKAHPADPRVPQALYLAVRATRYGCTDKNTGELSHTAFDLLHQRYANSEWARKTPYWFQQ